MQLSTLQERNLLCSNFKSALQINFLYTSVFQKGWFAGLLSVHCCAPIGVEIESEVSPIQQNSAIVWKKCNWLWLRAMKEFQRASTIHLRYSDLSPKQISFRFVKRYIQGRQLLYSFLAGKGKSPILRKKTNYWLPTDKVFVSALLLIKNHMNIQ